MGGGHVGVARLAIRFHELGEDECSIGAVRIMARETLACCGLHVLGLLRQIGLAMARVTESGYCGRQHARIAASMGVVAGTAHAPGNRCMQGLLFELRPVMAIEAEIRHVYDQLRRGPFAHVCSSVAGVAAHGDGGVDHGILALVRMAVGA